MNKARLQIVPDGGFEPQEHSRRMRSTSAEAFRAIKGEALLSEMRLLVYEVLYNDGPLTGAELDEMLRGIHGGRGHYHKRLSELKRLGVAREVGKRKCRVTGREAYEWDVTDQLPAERLKPVPRPCAEDLRDTLDLMRRYYRDEMRKGTAPPESFVRVMRWIASKVPPKENGSA